MTVGRSLSLPGHVETCLKVGRHLHDTRGRWAGLETRSRSDGVLEDQRLRLEIRRAGVGRSHLPSSFLWTGEQKKQPSMETTTRSTGRITRAEQTLGNPGASRASGVASGRARQQQEC